MVKIDESEPVPEDPRAFSGMALMGGPMSVNDDLPWIEPMLALIRAAVADHIPVLGHCLGGQLMAKAMGGAVTRNRVKEIGWGRVDVLENAEAEHWLGTSLKSFDAFHWHGEMFSIPPGAVRIASSPYCENQVFVLDWHLAMQCHVEMTPELIRTWCCDWEEEVKSLAACMPSVQTPTEMIDRVGGRVRALNAVADRVYDGWAAGVKRS